MIGQTIGRYRIVGSLGAGGMGVVYRGDDLELHRPVALKFLSAEFAADPEKRARLLREARLAAALSHPNTCAVYEVGEANGTPFIAMEFIDGDTLAALLSRSGRLTVSESLEIATQVAEGLADAHSRHIVHRDLKPHNVMLTRDGRVKILDFGLAKPLESARVAGATLSTDELISADLGHRRVVGTCSYMSPEQALGQPVDSRSDVFAFGVMLHELAGGARPFRADTATAVLAKIIEAEPEPLPASVPAELARIVRRCLQKKPERRYNDTRDLVADLKDVSGSLARRHGSGTSNASNRTAPVGPEQMVDQIGVLRLRLLSAQSPQDLRRLLYETEALLSAAPHDAEVRILRDEIATALIPDEAATRPSGIRGPIGAAGIGANAALGRFARTTARARVLIHQPWSKPTGAAVLLLALAALLFYSTMHRTVPVPQVVHVTRTPAPTERPTDAGLKRPQSAGTLMVTSNPTSTVTLDERPIGVTPLKYHTTPGRHDLTLTSKDGLVWRGRIDVAADRPATLHRELTAVGSISVVSNIQVEVSLDGGPSKRTPVSFPRVAAGLHELRAVREGYVPQRIEVIVEESKTTNIRVKMEMRP
jgi:serine/threonine protein kinase